MKKIIPIVVLLLSFCLVDNAQAVFINAQERDATKHVKVASKVVKLKLKAKAVKKNILKKAVWTGLMNVQS